MKSIKKLFFIVCSFVSAAQAASQGDVKMRQALAVEKAVQVKNGMNKVDLVGDGADSIVVVAERENSNAHDQTTAVFYMLGSRNENKLWKIVPFLGGQKELDMLHISGGADCALSTFRLIQTKTERSLAVVIARRELGSSFADSAPVLFDVYRLKKNADQTPGFPTYYFQFERSLSAAHPYCDVNQAFKEELGVGESFDR